MSIIFKLFFKNKLFSLIKNNNLTNKALADKINVSKAAIGQFVKGNSMPSIEKLIEISNVFQISIDTLLGRPKLLNNPDGTLEYCLKTSNDLLEGELKYSFGILDNNADKKAFLFIDEINGKLIDYLLESHSQTDFLALVYLLNKKLSLDYDAFENNNVDILIKLNDHYQEIYIDLGYSARLSLIKYENYVSDWLELSAVEKIQKIKEIYEK